MERCYIYLCGLILFLGSSLTTSAFAGERHDQEQVQPASASEAPATYKLHVKKGSKDDIEAIGKRKIVERDWYSLDKEIKLGREESEQLDQHIQLEKDLSVTEYISRVSLDLLRNSDVNLPVTIKVVDSDEGSVFSLPGYLYINSGLVLDCANEAELAGVVSHAIAHIAARHETRMMTREELQSVLSKPIIFAGEQIQSSTVTFSHHLFDRPGPEVPRDLLKFYRNFEMEADYFGIQYLYKTGYDPNAFVARLRREDNRHHIEPGFAEAKSAAQPVPVERITAAEKEIARILPPTDHLVVNRPEFDSIKAKLAERRNRKQAASQGSATSR